MNPPQMKLAEIKVESDGGPWCKHNMPCPVYLDNSAVLEMNSGVFHPSWQAQEAGWRLVNAETRLQKWVLRILFK